MLADCAAFDFMRPGVADVVLCIAVLHHISTLQRRVAAMHNIVRLLRPGGEALLQVWAFEQDEASRRKFDQQDVMVSWRLNKKFIDERTDSTTLAALSTAAADDSLATVEVQRYCHVFHQGELEQLVAATGEAEIVHSWYERSNWCMLIRKHGGELARADFNP